jgi:hypothetical protein
MGKEIMYFKFDPHVCIKQFNKLCDDFDEKHESKGSREFFFIAENEEDNLLCYILKSIKTRIISFLVLFSFELNVLDIRIATKYFPLNHEIDFEEEVSFYF